MQNLSHSGECFAFSSFGKQNAVPVLLQEGGGIPCRPNPAATLLVYSCVVTIHLCDIITVT